ncbi:11449_t:CDS:2 [Entrophospora sp. SA101]|nr:11449_t:CDS:2 [Entrophospora sp. SA101]
MRSDCGYIGKIDDITDFKDFEEQLINYVTKMKKNDRIDYTSTSVNACLAAINRHIVEKSLFNNLDLYHNNRCTYKRLWQIVDGKLRYLDELGLAAFYLHPLKFVQDWGCINNWYQPNNIGQTKLKNWLCKITVETDATDIETMSISSHRSTKGFASYERPKDDLQLLG